MAIHEELDALVGPRDPEANPPVATAAGVGVTFEVYPTEEIRPMRTVVVERLTEHGQDEIGYTIHASYGEALRQIASRVDEEDAAE